MPDNEKRKSRLARQRRTANLPQLKTFLEFKLKDQFTAHDMALLNRIFDPVLDNMGISVTKIKIDIIRPMDHLDVIDLYHNAVKVNTGITTFIDQFKTFYCLNVND